MPNYYLSVLYKHIFQVENKNVGLKVGGHKHTIAPPSKKWGGGAHAPLAPPLPTPVIYIYIYLYIDQWFHQKSHMGIDLKLTLYNWIMFDRNNLWSKDPQFFLTTFV